MSKRQRTTSQPVLPCAAFQSHLLRRGCFWLIVLLFAGKSFAAENLTLLGRIVVPNDLQLAGTTVGGLSGISYDAGTKTFWTVSDDSNHRGGPPRAYQFRLRFTAEGMPAADFLRTLPMRDAAGRLLRTADLEGIACTGSGGLWISSEGKAGSKGDVPWLRLFDQKTGRQQRNLPLPAVYLPANAGQQPVPIDDAAQVSGVVGNKSLESCALSADRRILYTASETSLLQEKAPGEITAGAGLFNSTQVRLSALDLRSGRCLAQKLYVARGGCFFGSISDLCSIGKNRLLVLERRVVALFEGPGSCQVLLHEIDLDQPDATDLRAVPDVNGKNISPLSKRLVFDSLAAGLQDLDNIEGLCLAPAPGGGQILLVISDNNFNAREQTQILVFRYPSNL